MSTEDALSDWSTPFTNEENSDDPSRPTPFENSIVTEFMNVPHMFHKFITRSTIAKKLHCQLVLPPRSIKPNLKIVADSQDTIEKAKQSITDLVSSTRSRLPPTHFICLPVQNAVAIESYKSFKSKVLENSTENPLYKDIDEDLFTSEFKLHFTLATLLLADQKEIELASQILETFRESETGKFLSTEPLHITIRGLKIMQETPRYSHVLYATVC